MKFARWRLRRSGAAALIRPSLVWPVCVVGVLSGTSLGCRADAPPMREDPRVELSENFYIPLPLSQGVSGVRTDLDRCAVVWSDRDSFVTLISGGRTRRLQAVGAKRIVTGGNGGQLTAKAFLYWKFLRTGEGAIRGS